VAVKIVYEYAEVPAVDRASHEKAGWRIYGMSKFRDAVTYKMKRVGLTASPVV
jgi:hypothetical protein